MGSNGHRGVVKKLRTYIAFVTVVDADEDRPKGLIVATLAVRDGDEQGERDQKRLEAVLDAASGTPRRRSHEEQGTNGSC